MPCHTPAPRVYDELLQGPSDDGRPGPSGTSCLPLDVPDADLDDRVAVPAELVEQLGVDHRATALELMCTEELGAEQLERAIHIADRDAQEQAHQLLPAPGVETAHPCVLAIYAIAPHRVVLAHQRQEACELADVELPIGVHEKDQIVASGLEPRDERRAVPAVDVMCNRADAAVARRERIEGFARPVGAAIVDNHYLELQLPL